MKKVKIITDDEAAALPPKESAVVCMRKDEDRGYFADNVEAPCCICGVVLIHRPHAPAIDKICLRCAIAAGMFEGDAQLSATSKSAAEAVEVLQLLAAPEGTKH